MKPKFFCCQFLFSVYCFLLVNNASAQWPQWRGPQRDGVSVETNLLKVWPAEGPKLLWSVNSVGDGFSSTAIQDKMVFTCGKRDSVEILTAMDLNGTVKWQKPYGKASDDKEWPQSRATPAIYKNKVYAVSVTGNVACLDCKTGNIDWQRSMFRDFGGAVSQFAPVGITESPLLIDDKLIITPGGNSTTMVALNRLTGETIWKSESIQDTVSYTSPVLIPAGKDGRAIFSSTQKYDFIVDPNSGKIIWKDWHVSGTIPLVFKNQIFATGEFNQVGTLCSWNDDLTKRSVMWSDSVTGNFMGGAVLYNGIIVVSSADKGIFCLDPKTGKIVSRYEKMTCCNFLVADNMLYSYEDRMGRVSLFKMNGNDLELVSQFKITLGNGPRLAHMSIADGLLFIRRGEVLMAYDIKNESKVN